MDRPRRSDWTAGQMDGEAGWWTTSGNIGLPPLARAMGVGRQQHCGKTPHDVKHLFNCPAHPNDNDTVGLMEQTCGRNPGTQLSQGGNTRLRWTRLKGEQQQQRARFFNDPKLYANDLGLMAPTMGQLDRRVAEWRASLLGKRLKVNI